MSGPAAMSKINHYISRAKDKAYNAKTRRVILDEFDQKILSIVDMKWKSDPSTHTISRKLGSCPLLLPSYFKTLRPYQGTCKTFFAYLKITF